LRQRACRNCENTEDDQHPPSDRTVVFQFPVHSVFAFSSASAALRSRVFCRNRAGQGPGWLLFPFKAPARNTPSHTCRVSGWSSAGLLLENLARCADYGRGANWHTPVMQSCGCLRAKAAGVAHRRGRVLSNHELKRSREQTPRTNQLVF
jgi:hypothetical protein